MTLLDNQDVAVLTRVNDLAERHGLKPYDFVTTFKPAGDGNGFRYILSYESFVTDNELRKERFDKMLSDIGINQGASAALIGDTSVLIDALDNALQIAPRSRYGL